MILYHFPYGKMAINQWFICCIPFLLWYVCTCFRRLLLEEEEISNVGTRTYIPEKKWYTTNKPQIYCHFSIRKMMKNHAIFHTLIYGVVGM